MIKSFLQLFRGKLQAIPQGVKYMPVTSFQVDDIMLIRIVNHFGWYWRDIITRKQYGDYISIVGDGEITEAVIDETFNVLFDQANLTKDRING